MPVVHLIVPGPIGQQTGGYIYDRRMVEGLRALGWQVVVHELEGAFPLVDARAEAAAGRALAAIDGTALPVIDGLALPAFAHLADRLGRPWVALIHHPLALETGLEAADAETLAAVEHRLLGRVARVIVTSAATARDLAGAGVPAGRIGVAPPGADRAPLARGSESAAPTMLTVGSLIPRKGHLVLIKALASLADLDWRLVVVGSPARDPGHAAAVAAAIEDAGLGDRITLVGECPAGALDDLYDRADLFMLASYHEGYGMVLAEALARGLPVVSTRAGAIPGTVPADAGILVPSGDAAALAAALRRVLGDPGVRRELAAGARAARAALSGWDAAAARFADELNRVGDGGRVRSALAPTA